MRCTVDLSPCSRDVRRHVIFTPRLETKCSIDDREESFQAKQGLIKSLVDTRWLTLRSRCGAGAASDGERRTDRKTNVRRL